MIPYLWQYRLLLWCVTEEQGSSIFDATQTCPINTARAWKSDPEIQKYTPKALEGMGRKEIGEMRAGTEIEICGTGMKPQSH